MNNALRTVTEPPDSVVEHAYGKADRATIWSMIQDIPVPGMVTLNEECAFRSRPMWAMKRKTDDGVWFFTRSSSAKAIEIELSPEVLLVYAEPAEMRYVSINGIATLIRDKAIAEELWSENFRAWFPMGIDDPDLALIRVEIEVAEYWDTETSKMVLAYRAVKAHFTGEPEPTMHHGRVTL